MILEHEAVCDAILDYLSGVVLVEIHRNSKLQEDELLDSFDKVGLIGHLEELLGISVEPEQLIDGIFTNIDSIADWALQLKAAS